MSPNRYRIPLPFGSGLDRESGAMTTAPASMDDLRNVFVHKGKVIVRKGFQTKLTFTEPGLDDMTDIIAGHSLTAQRVGVVVGYNSATGEVHIFETDSNASTVQHVGEWDATLSGGDFPLAVGSPPPTVIMAESAGWVFIAHDDPLITSRATTIYYTRGVPSTLTKLTADFDEGSGVADIKFRGVARHLDFLWGWGFGDATNDEPGYVRVSLPGNPITFTHERWLQIGDFGAPVIRCVQVGQVDGGALLVLKETETYEIRGTNRDNFGEFLVDPLYGMSFSRLAVNVSGLVFVWTNAGPRVFGGGSPSKALDLPLELYQAEPSSLPAASELHQGWAEFLPGNYRCVLFCFGQRVYVLTIRIEGDWKWSYWEWGYPIASAFRMPALGSGLVGAPTGFADNVVASAITDTTATITVDNNAQTGDEQIEIWSEPNGGVWELLGTFQVTVAATDAHAVTGFSAGLDQTVRVRYKRGNQYGAGYTSSNPADWPASSEELFQTTLTSVPTISTLQWFRTSAVAERIRVSIDPMWPSMQIYPDVEIDRDLTLIDTEVAPPNTFTHDDFGIAGETDEDYRTRFLTADLTGSYSATSSLWAGPIGPTVTSLADALGEDYVIQWTNGLSIILLNWVTEVWDDYTRPSGPLGSAFPNPETLEATKGAGVTSHGATGLGGSSGSTIEVGVRHKHTTFAVDDYSDFDTDTLPMP